MGKVFIQVNPNNEYWDNIKEVEHTFTNTEEVSKFACRLAIQLDCEVRVQIEGTDDEFFYNPYTSTKYIKRIVEGEEKSAQEKIKKEPTTILEWLNTLEEPYRTQAINNLDKGLEDTKSDSIDDALSRAFVWEGSKEGNDYWSNLSDSLEL
jgi:hypothetical protein